MVRQMPAVPAAAAASPLPPLPRRRFRALFFFLRLAAAAKRTLDESVVMTAPSHRGTRARSTLAMFESMPTTMGRQRQSGTHENDTIGNVAAASRLALRRV